MYSVDMSVSWFAPAKPDSIYSYEIMRGATPFINLTVLYVPNGAASGCLNLRRRRLSLLKKKVPTSCRDFEVLRSSLRQDSIARLLPPDIPKRLRAHRRISDSVGDRGGAQVVLKASISWSETPLHSKLYRPYSRIMRRVLVGGVYVVQAKKDDVLEYWAAATLQKNAVAAVENAHRPPAY